MPDQFVADVEGLEAAKLEELITYEFPFDLHERYGRAFNLFKGAMSVIINDIHIKLAQTRNASSVLNEDNLNRFSVFFTKTMDFIVDPDFP